MICVVNGMAAVSVLVHKVSVQSACVLMVGHTWTAYADIIEVIAVLELVVNKESGLH